MCKPGNILIYVLFSAMIATAVFAYPTTSGEFDDVVGGLKIMLNGQACKDPCTAGEKIVDECDDLLGQVGKCELTRCTRNKLKYVKCAEPAAGNEAANCEYHLDNTKWWRWITVRSVAAGCTDNGQVSGDYGGTKCSADGNKNPSWSTPCKTPICNAGPIFQGIDRREGPKNRPTCGAGP